MHKFFGNLTAFKKDLCKPHDADSCWACGGSQMLVGFNVQKDFTALRSPLRDDQDPMIRLCLSACGMAYMHSFNAQLEKRNHTAGLRKGARSQP